MLRIRVFSIFAYKTPLRPLNREDTDRCTLTITGKTVIDTSILYHLICTFANDLSFLNVLFFQGQFAFQKFLNPVADYAFCDVDILQLEEP